MSYIEDLKDFDRGSLMMTCKVCGARIQRKGYKSHQKTKAHQKALSE